MGPNIYEARSACGLLLSLTRHDGPLMRIAQAQEEKYTEDRIMTDFLHYLQGEIFQIHTLLPGLRSRLAVQGLPPSVSSLLTLLECLMTTPTCSGGSYAKLWALVKQTSDAENPKSSEGDLGMLFDFGERTLRDDILEAFGVCVDDISASVDSNSFDTSETKLSKRQEPNYEVWKLSSLLFDAFWTTTSQCGECKTPTTTLALVTHRRALETLDVEAILSLNDHGVFDQEVRFRICSTE